MPKLPSLTPKKIIRILKKKGFKLDRTRGSHYIFYHPATRKRVTVPLHKKDLPKGTFLEILRQAGISRDELKTISQNLAESRESDVPLLEWADSIRSRKA